MAKGRSADSQSWSQDEIVAVVDAYFEMLDDDTNGQHFVKAQIYRHLQAESLPTRSTKSIERKMQNISTTFERHNLCHLRGLKPLRNSQKLLDTAVEERLLALGWIKPDGQ